jgi:sec-independent protein translocase protein TatA
MKIVWLLFNFGGGEIFIVLLFVLLFFGSKQIPEIARALGKGLREIRNATDDIKREINDTARDVNVKKGFEEEVNKTINEIKGSVSRQPKPRNPAENQDEPKPDPNAADQSESDNEKN